MTISTVNLGRCVETLEASLRYLREATPSSIDYEIYRNSVIKGFELTLEISGKLIKKALKNFESNTKTVDSLYYKDVIRWAGKHNILTIEAISRWFAYRDNRNSTAHDYGEVFAEETLGLLPSFIADIRTLIERLNELNGYE